VGNAHQKRSAIVNEMVGSAHPTILISRTKNPLTLILSPGGEGRVRGNNVP